MFSSKSKPLSSPSRVSIEEANSHLKLVHQRVEQLETMISSRDQQLIQSEDSHRQEVLRLTQAYDRHCEELNREIEFLRNKVKDLENKVLTQKEIIDGNEQKLEKWSQILTLRPNLDKLLSLMDGLAIDGHNSGKEVVNHKNNEGNQSSNETQICNNHQNVLQKSNSEQMNGFCDTIGTDRQIPGNIRTKKSVKYRTMSDQSVCLNGGKDEEVVSTTSTSTTTSGQSPSANSTSVGDRNGLHRKSSNSKLKIGRSFNITSNFSDDEEVVADKRPSARRKKVTEI